MQFDVKAHMFGSKVIGSKISDSKELKHINSHQNGYSIGEENGKFLNLFLNFTDGYHEFGSFKGGVNFDGRKYFFDERTSVSEIESIFVNVVAGFKDEVEVSRTFLVNGLEIECSWYHDSKGISFTYIFAELSTGYYEANGT